MNLAREAFAAALALWFLWQARKKPLYLLGIPVLMVMRGSVFFQELRPFWTPGRFSPETHLMIWLGVVWVVTVLNPWHREHGKVGLFGPSRVLPEELVFVPVVALIAVHVAGVFSASGDLAQGVTAAYESIYLLLGYLFVRGIVGRASREETVEFLGAVVVVNAIAAAMYVIHQGLHITIYPGNEYSTEIFGGQQLTRTFSFMPQFSLLALGYVLARRQWELKWLAVLAVTVLAILVSYTRTLLIAAVAAIVIAIVVRELKKPDAARFARRSLTIVASVVAVVVIFAVARPVEYRFLTTRLGDFASANGVSDVGNWRIRQGHFDIVKDYVTSQDALLGVGYPQTATDPVAPHLYLWTSDSTWVPILYRFGYGGLFLFGLLLVAFGVRSLEMSQQPPEERSYLGLAFLITIAMTSLVAFTSWTFMEPRIAPMGLYFLAFVSAEALRQPEPAEVEAGVPASQEASTLADGEAQVAG